MLDSHLSHIKIIRNVMAAGKFTDTFAVLRRLNVLIRHEMIQHERDLVLVKNAVHLPAGEGKRDIVEAVAERLQRYQIQNVVLDTVMLAKSGDPLLSPSAVATLRSRLLPQVSLITPNLPEAAALLDAPHARTEQEMLEQGRSLLAMGCGAVLMKGGHLDDEQSPDWLFTREGEQRFTAPRIMTKNTHGTGCTLSAALAALRPRHTNWADTVQEAKSWLSSALAQADTLEVGHGIGPVHHFHAWW